MSLEEPSHSGSRDPLISPEQNVKFEFAPSNHNCKEKCRSASRLLVKFLTEIQCKSSGCADPFSRDNLPLMGICGHYFCNKHKKDEGPTKCKEPECKKTENKDFISDAILDDLYYNLVRSGFQCIYCNKFHPPKNVVARSGTQYFYCVWCATSKESIYRFDFENTERDPIVSPRQILNSIEYDQCDAGWALNTCCLCWEILYIPHKHKTTKIALLSCCHIVHPECLNKHGIKDEKHNDYRVKCRLCGINSLLRNIKERTAHAREYIKTLRFPHNDLELRDYKYIECKNCTHFHPSSNMSLLFREVCVWCALVKKDIERVENEAKVKRDPKSTGIAGLLRKLSIKGNPK